jgi:DNA-binding MarR family transcriptional regulator
VTSTEHRAVASSTPATALSLGDALVRLAHVVDYVFTDVSRAAGLTPQQTQLLCVLSTGPAGMTELSHRLHLERSSLTGLVDRAVKRGLIQRHPDAADRRACTIALTDEGRHVAESAHREITQRLDALTSATSARARTDLARTAAQIAANY